MLTLTLTPSLAPKAGRGLWRMNTQIPDNAEFLSTLDILLSTQEEPQLCETRQRHWDRVKEEIKRCCIKQSISIRRNQQTTIHDLNNARQSILRDLSQSSGTTKDTLARDLDELELLLQQQTIEELDLHALRSGTIWREQGETNAAYFFRAIAERRSKRLVSALHNPTTNSLTTSTEERL
ncbi:hypothetical protein BKA57DRAFT_508251 [Linnemannia elongata]|nr:hypothetical protein BKA57DRAFT_508251 [Linnemannia elongata]